MFAKLFKPKPEKLAGKAIYDTIVRAARQEALYRDMGIQDTLEGRFESILLHAALVIGLLHRSEDAYCRVVAQATFDALFDDLDAAMREMGVGDSGVGKKIRFMAEGFYGRAKAYEDAMADQDPSALANVLARNLLGGDDVEGAPRKLAHYVLKTMKMLEEQGAQTIVESQAPVFPAP